MKALTYGSFGPPEVIRVEDVADPVPAFDDVRVRVYATSVTAADASFRSGKPLSARLYAGPFRPRFPTLGGLVSGEVDAVGSGVTRLRVGDRVLGFTGPRLGAHAGYVCLPAGGAVVSKPADLTDVQSVAACEGAIVALPFLRDEAHLRPGRSVLINGASGSVGSAAVQLAKHFGAHVTAVCRGVNADLVCDRPRRWPRIWSCSPSSPQADTSDRSSTRPTRSSAPCRHTLAWTLDTRWALSC